MVCYMKKGGVAVADGGTLLVRCLYICKASVLKYSVKEGGFVRVMSAGQLASVGASAQKEEGKEEMSGNNNLLKDPSLMSVSQHPSIQSYESELL